MMLTLVNRGNLWFTKWVGKTGCLDSVEWNSGLEWWNGLEWWTGMGCWNGTVLW